MRRIPLSETPAPFCVADLFYVVLQFLSLKDIHFFTICNTALFSLRNDIRNHSVGEEIFQRIRRLPFTPVFKPIQFEMIFDLSHCNNQLHHFNESMQIRGDLIRSNLCETKNKNEILLYCAYQLLIFSAETGAFLRTAEKTDYDPSKLRLKSLVKKYDHRLPTIKNATICCAREIYFMVFALYRDRDNRLFLQKFHRPEKIFYPQKYNSAWLFKDSSDSEKETPPQKSISRKRSRE